MSQNRRIARSLRTLITMKASHSFNLFEVNLNAPSLAVVGKNGFCAQFGVRAQKAAHMLWFQRIFLIPAQKNNGMFYVIQSPFVPIYSVRFTADCHKVGIVWPNVKSELLCLHPNAFRIENAVCFECPWTVRLLSVFETCTSYRKRRYESCIRDGTRSIISSAN